MSIQKIFNTVRFALRIRERQLDKFSWDARVYLKGNVYADDAAIIESIKTAGLCDEDIAAEEVFTRAMAGEPAFHHQLIHGEKPEKKPQYRYVRPQQVKGIGLLGLCGLIVDREGVDRCEFVNEDLKDGRTGIGHLDETTVSNLLEFCIHHDGKEGEPADILEWFKYQHDIFSFSLAYLQANKIVKGQPLDTPLHRHPDVHMNLFSLPLPAND